MDGRGADAPGISAVIRACVERGAGVPGWRRPVDTGGDLLRTARGCGIVFGDEAR